MDNGQPSERKAHGVCTCCNIMPHHIKYMDSVGPWNSVHVDNLISSLKCFGVKFYRSYLFLVD